MLTLLKALIWKVYFLVYAGTFENLLVKFLCQGHWVKFKVT